MSRDTNGKKKMKLSLFFQKLFFIIAIPILIISCTIIYKAYRYPDEIPDVFGVKPLIVLSESMEPTIKKGDLIFAKEVESDTLKVDDVIAFRNEADKVTTHRITEIIESDDAIYYRTKGDNNNTEDLNLVLSDDLEGLYVKRIAKLGNVLMFIQQPLGLAVVILAILVIGLIRLNMVSKKENQQMKKRSMDNSKEEMKKETKV